MTRLEVTDLAAGYHGRPVISQVSLSAQGGQFVALAGPNGSGKSTLIKVLAGLIAPSAGQVSLDGQALETLPARVRARRIAYMPPEGQAAWPLIARRAVALGRVPHLKPLRALTAQDEAAIDSALDCAGVAELADRPLDTLSSGERARVMLARVLSTGADILLLDEPTAALDPRHQIAVMEVLRAEAGRGALVIAAAHALDLAARWCDTALLMQDGKIAASGPPATVFSEANLDRVFGASPPGGVTPATWRARQP